MLAVLPGEDPWTSEEAEEARAELVSEVERLKAEIASGTAPDIIGPVGVEGLNLFADQLLDLKSLIQSTGFSCTQSSSKFPVFTLPEKRFTAKGAGVILIIFFLFSRAHRQNGAVWKAPRED